MSKLVEKQLQLLDLQLLDLCGSTEEEIKESIDEIEFKLELKNGVGPGHLGALRTLWIELEITKTNVQDLQNENRQLKSILQDLIITLTNDNENSNNNLRELINSINI